jgi:hypothetical protein
MTRLRLVLVVAVVLLLGWSLVGRGGTTWTTYENAKEGWTIERPASATIQQAANGVTFTKGSLALTVRDAGPTKRPDTQLPLDPVDFLPASDEPSGGTMARAMSVVAHHRAFEIQAVTAGSGDQATAFRMLRSLRFP